ncbi:ferritin-like domain-containing protein [Chromobacterium vaccinii]|uniref:ferritin-like domain-containing protein n=1 Tax=Chromobacterium vaccinii TaxID=1108595 RepID=UPI003C765D6F
MLKIDPKFVRELLAATTPEQLHFFLQKAVELEHSTIPPYLTAQLSLKPGQNREIGALIHGIVMEEMLHMTIAANILIAIGGHPRINTPDFIPRYPGPLPMGIGGDLTVGIEAFSLELTRDIFMAIEEPADPVPIHQLKQLYATNQPAPTFHTIGEFYDSIKLKLTELADQIRFGHRDKQVLHYFPEAVLFPIVDLDSALAAIDVIITQGEGTRGSPYQDPKAPEKLQDLAHYYKFDSIAHQREITPCPDGDGYCFGGRPIPFDRQGVWPMPPTPKPEDYPQNTQERTLIERFAYSYSSLLNALHRAFNGEPAQMDTAIGLMFDLKVLAASLMDPAMLLGYKESPARRPIGLSFVYRDVQNGMSYD